METLANKIMREWTAIYNKTKKGKIKDEITRSKLGNFNRLPCLKCKKYDKTKMSSMQELEREGDRVLENPKLEWCGVVLDLTRFNFQPYMHFFEDYNVGDKVKHPQE